MSNKQTKLSPTQRRIAVSLMRLKTPASICAELTISRATYYVHLSQIRSRTGIDDLTNIPALTAYLRRTHEMQEKEMPLSPSATQLAVLRLRCINNMPYKQICKKLKMALSTAQNHASQGYKRLGIPTTCGVYERMTKVKKALMELQPKPYDPMDDPAFGGPGFSQ